MSKEISRSYDGPVDDIDKPSLPTWATGRNAEISRMSNEKIEQAAREIAEAVYGVNLLSLPTIKSILTRHFSEPAPVEGTWAWALEQMKAGQRVTNGNTNGYYEFTDAIATAGGERFLTLYNPAGISCSQGTLLMPDDFDATDWRIAPPSEGRIGE